MICKGCNKEHSARAWKYNKGWWCDKYFTPTRTEFVPQRIRDDREKYFNSIVQPYRRGELSKEYIEAHGTENIDATSKEIKRARYTWKDLPGHANRHKSE